MLPQSRLGENAYDVCLLPQTLSPSGLPLGQTTERARFRRVCVCVCEDFLGSVDVASPLAFTVRAQDFVTLMHTQMSSSLLQVS